MKYVYVDEKEAMDRTLVLVNDPDGCVRRVILVHGLAVKAR